MITLSESAAAKLKNMMKKTDRIGVRPAVRGGGCSGFTYKLEFVTLEDPSDRLIESNGVKLYVDPKSFLYLMGTEIDYVDELSQSGFKFVNPNAKRTCGCGESFSV